MRNGSRSLSGAGAQTFLAAIPSPYLAGRMNQRQLHAKEPSAFRRASTRVGWSRPAGTDGAR